MAGGLPDLRQWLESRLAEVMGFFGTDEIAQYVQA